MGLKVPGVLPPGPEILSIYYSSDCVQETQLRQTVLKDRTILEGLVLQFNALYYSVLRAPTSLILLFLPLSPQMFFKKRSSCEEKDESISPSLQIVI